MYKIKTVIALTATLLVFTACTAENSLELDESLFVPEKTQYKETTAMMGDYATEVSSGVTIVYMHNEYISCDEQGFIKEILVERSDYVHKGDKIVSYTTGASDISLQEKYLELERLQGNYNNAISSYNAQIVTENQILSTLTVGSYEYDLQKLNIEKIQTAHEKNLFTMNYSIGKAQETIDTMQEELDVKYIYAPFDGEVIDMQTFEEGDIINQTTKIVQIVSSKDYLLKLENSSDFNWGEEVRLDVGQGKDLVVLYFDVVSTSDVLSYDLSEFPCYLKLNPAKSGVAADYTIPNNTSLRAYAVSEFMPDVLLLEADAVTADSGECYVYVLENGNAKKRYITSNYNNSEYYWVENGLSQEQIVVTK